MFLNLSPATLGIAGIPLLERPAFARRHGFGGVDLPLAELTGSAIAEAARDAAERSGVSWGLFDAPVFLDAPEAEFAAGLARLEAVAPWLQRAGCRRTYNHVWSGHDSLDYPANLAVHRQRLAAIATICARHDLVFGLEFLGPQTLQQQFRHPFIRTAGQMLELLAGSEHGAGLVVDAFHLHTSGGTAATIAQLPPEIRIVNVHLNDARPDRRREEKQDGERAMPLETGVIDTAELVRAVAGRGYDGPLIAEPFEPWRSRLAALPPGEAARIAREWLQRVLDRADPASVGD